MPKKSRLDSFTILSLSGAQKPEVRHIMLEYAPMRALLVDRSTCETAAICSTKEEVDRRLSLKALAMLQALGHIPPRKVEPIGGPGLYLLRSKVSS